jgi:hypothetical protein
MCSVINHYKVNTCTHVQCEVNTKCMIIQILSTEYFRLLIKVQDHCIQNLLHSMTVQISLQKHVNYKSLKGRMRMLVVKSVIMRGLG